MKSVVRYLFSPAFLLMAAGAACAEDMTDVAKTIAVVKTQFAGDALICCDDTKGWKFQADAAVDSGRDVITIRITNEIETAAPKFGVIFRVSGAGVQNVWTSNCAEDGCHLWPQLWWKWHGLTTNLACETPICVGFNSRETAPVAIACSDVFNVLKMALYADDRTCEVVGRCEFFVESSSVMKQYEVKVLFDRRGKSLPETVRSCSDWIEVQNGFSPSPVPLSAREPLYSTWYAYLQDVRATDLEQEALLAAELGMKVMILDDGWQKDDSKAFYSATGDWMPAASRFPDMRAHVDKVHRAGLKYMLWLSVPFVGDESKAYVRFKDKLLSFNDHVGILDPRFPEVREYLISTYERVVGEWGFDGLKLDFIDSFRLPSEDPAIRVGYAGRDYRSLPMAVDRLMRDVNSRVRAIKPDALIEFRQHYMGPAVRQYGNMIRVSDCPADPCANRRRMCDLRLTSGNTAVHSDMLVWSKDETAEGAALPILNVLFSTIQYSMIIKDLPTSHRAVVRHWIDFSRQHREALQTGMFVPHHAENGYTWIEGEGSKERVVAAYSADVCVSAGNSGKHEFLVNATGSKGMLCKFSKRPRRIELFDCCGCKKGEIEGGLGVVQLPIPPSGYARVIPRDSLGTFFDPKGMSNIASNETVVTNAMIHKTIAFLGGSITEMHGYRPRVMALLRRKHPNVAFTEIAAGLSSTCSDAAAFRLERDVLAKGIPDVLVVEEAVNDEQDGHFGREHSIRGMEGIVRKMLAVNPRCKVVIGLMVNKAQYEELVSGRIPRHYEAHRAVAEHYGIPVADIGTALAESSRMGGFSWKEYKDCHPSPEGCDFAARILMSELEKAFDPFAVPPARTLPDPLDAASFFRSWEIPLEAVSLSVGWRVAKPRWDGIPGDKRDYFIRGNVLTTDVPGKPLSLSFEGRTLAALVTAGPDAGDVEISIDGGEWRLHRSRADYLPLHYPYVLMIAESLPSGRHVVVIRTKRSARQDGFAAALRIHSLFVD